MVNKSADRQDWLTAATPLSYYGLLSPPVAQLRDRSEIALDKFFSCWDRHEQISSASSKLCAGSRIWKSSRVNKKTNNYKHREHLGTSTALDLPTSS